MQTLEDEKSVCDICGKEAIAGIGLKEEVKMVCEEHLEEYMKEQKKLLDIILDNV